MEKTPMSEERGQMLKRQKQDFDEDQGSSPPKKTKFQFVSIMSILSSIMSILFHTPGEEVILEAYAVTM